mmetsp:Transcript_38267/g.108211  ORF Transcript_38267/g.108211 Transcript_38267/m.108211 type:complete len:200 (+) Transcript_38267:457-1056(+)
MVLVLLGALQHRFYEDGGHHVQHRQHRERDVRADEGSEDVRDLFHEGDDDVVPVDPPCHGLEECQHRPVQRAEVLVEALEVAVLFLGRVGQPVVRDELRDEEADSVDQQHEEDERPAQGGHRAGDRGHKPAELGDVVQNADQADGTDKPQNAQDAHEAEVWKQITHHYLRQLQPNHDGVEQVPMPVAPVDKSDAEAVYP